MQSPHGAPAPQRPGRSSHGGGRLLEAGTRRAAGDGGPGLKEHKGRAQRRGEDQSQVCFRGGVLYHRV